MNLNDKFIAVGFWSQVVLLFLVDWGSLAAFRRHGAPWYHLVGFAVVNVVLIFSTALMWTWMRRARRRD